MSLIAQGRGESGWKIYAGIIVVADVAYQAAHRLVLARAVYRPIVPRLVPRAAWASSCCRRCPPSSPSRSVWLGGNGFPRFVTFSSRQSRVSLMVAGRADFSRPLAVGRARCAVGSAR
jgi:hypothetical protein